MGLAEICGLNITRMDARIPPVFGAAALIVAANGRIVMDNLLFVKQPQSLLACSIEAKLSKFIPIYTQEEDVCLLARAFLNDICWFCI